MLLRSNLFRLAAMLLALPVLGTCTAISINAVCQVGNCDSPDSIGVGQSSTGSFSYLYTFADGDQYSITGTFSNSYPGINTNFSPTVTYLDNNGNIWTPAVQTDVLSLVMFQNFYDPTGSSWDGQYCQSIPLSVTSLARANGNTYFDGDGIGFITAQPGISNQSSCANLGFTASQNASATMSTQTLLDFTFLGGNLQGASISSVAPPPPNNMISPAIVSDIALATPEPAQTVPAALALAGLALFAFRRKRTAPNSASASS